MKSSINTIKFLVVLSIVFLLVTYCISLNQENKWIVLNTTWLSSNFAFAISGGSFASILVMLACELQKYQSIKRQTEDYIFGQLFSLYVQVTIIHYNTRRQLNDISSPVPINLIEYIANRGKMCLANLTSIEYFTFYNLDAIKKQLSLYSGKSGMSIKEFLQNTLYLKLAISEDKMALLKQGEDKLITSQNTKTHHTLKKIYDDSSVVLSFIEKSLDIIDNKCIKRYHWGELKRNVISIEENFVSSDFDMYLKQPVIHLEEEEI